MERSEFSWERQSSLGAGEALSAADIQAIARLMLELRELTQSRGSFVAASNLLKRFGYEADGKSVVDPDPPAN